ncbi:response regulator [Chloroflexi bacterium TSY]|nr:response regulator [Chloroflexi bacterium TSY]
MDAFAAFEQALRKSLNQLHNPLYQPPALLWSVLGCQPQQGIKVLQTTIIQAIEDLKPPPDATAPNWNSRFYDVLHYRYVRGLTQETTATRMQLTPRHLRREQDRAIQGLAQQLWAQTPITPGDVYGDADSDPWRLQVRQELATLQQTTPEDKSNVATIIAGVEKVGQVLTTKHNIGLRVAAAPADQTAIIYPSSLRQVLLTAIEKLVQHLDSGEIRLESKQVEDQIIITVMGEPSYSQTLPDSDLIQELLSPYGGHLAIQQVEDQLSFQIRLQALDDLSRQKPVSVLVVDDNPDLITFYQLYVTNTRYQINHLADGKALFETIATARPDIIVLDVLLPDMDGWDLLTDLHEHSDTRDIPIIICSVIRREDLALALGASLYLPKPVRRQAFIQALDQVYYQASSANAPTDAPLATTL